MVSWLSQYQIDYNDPLVGVDHEMTMGATCLYTWCVNVTPQVWVSWYCCNQQTANSSPFQPGCNLTTPPGELLVREHSQVLVLLIIGHIINTHNHAIHVSSVTLTKTGSAAVLELAKDDH